MTTSVIAIADNGTQDVFTWNAGTSTWDPPQGVFDVLTPDGADWRLTHKAQSYDLFDGTGLLINGVDAMGNELDVLRVNGRIDRIKEYVFSVL